RFSLRTLLIVVTLLAIPCGYVGWQAKIVRQRQSMISRRPVVFYLEAPVANQPDVPWLHKFLQDVYIHEVILDPSVSAEGVARFEAAFPEAIVTLDGGISAHTGSTNKP